MNKIEMNNRELLELASKAVGYDELPIEGWTIDSIKGMRLVDTDHEFVRYWNPLDDDGDALSLAVKLKLEIYHAWDEVTQVCVGYPNVGKNRTDISYVLESYKDANILEATRRAIVRAAAEIGKSMKGKQ